MLTVSAPTRSAKVFHPEWMNETVRAKTRIISVSGAWNLWPSAAPGRADQWAMARKYLPGCEIITCNLSRHDGNGHPPHLMSIDDYARNLVNLLEKTGPAYVMGHSQGGLVSQRAENMAPKLFKGMILLASSPPRAEAVGGVTFNWRFARPSYLWAMATGLAYSLTPADQKFLCGNTEVQLGPESGLATQEVVCGEIAVKPAKCDTYVAVGDQDPLMSLKMQLELANFHRADFFCVEGVGHMLHLEAKASPILFKEIDRWLSHRRQ